MYNCVQLDSIYVAFRFSTKPTAPCSLVLVFLGLRRPLIDPSIPSSRQPPTIYLLLVVVVVFSKPPNLPILILWILNLHISMCPNCENWTSIGLNFLQHLGPCICTWIFICSKTKLREHSRKICCESPPPTLG